MKIKIDRISKTTLLSHSTYRDFTLCKDGLRMWYAFAHKIGSDVPYVLEAETLAGIKHVIRESIGETVDYRNHVKHCDARVSFLSWIRD